MTLSIAWDLPLTNKSINFVSLLAFTCVRLGCLLATKAIKTTTANPEGQDF